MESTATPATTTTTTTTHHPLSVNQVLDLIKSDDPDLMIRAAQEIRRLTKTSQRCRRQLSPAVPQLVKMLRVNSSESAESALLALLNLAVKDEKNKISIVDSGALDPIISFLGSENSSLQEYATASLLTLSASSVNKPTIIASGTIPLLVDVLETGTPQAKVDAVMALYNLSTHSNNINIILNADPVPPLIDLLKACKKSSKTAEKCTALLESLVNFEEGRDALVSEQGGILAVVEILESGSLQSREHAVGALLTLCEVDRCKYRDLILREGVIPGLLELTVQGTPKSQTKAHILLRLLRESPCPKSELQADTFGNIVCNIISQMYGEEPSGKAKKMLAEMVQVSMEQSLRHLQQRAVECTPSDLPTASCASQVPSK